ncbi:MFS transporter [Pseudonocardia sp. GCM10023141]|uniref:MFS transporter n=1 Tax=Pseudonocardia sp. GCM10023141 TaxID=3252653 RepID=UPI00360F4A14
MPASTSTTHPRSALGDPPAPSPVTYLKLATLAAAMFLVGTNAFVIAGLLPDIAHGLDASVTAVSYSITWYALVVAVAAPAVSILLARWSRTHLMTAGLVLVALGTLLAAAAGSVVVFTVGRIVAALGGAALVPVATAAAATLLPAAQRGRALAIVAVGFTLAAAVGSPLGTAGGAVGGWRLPLYVLAALAVVVAAAVQLLVRHIPRDASATLAQRLAPLRDRRIVLALATTLLMLAGFNIVYIFSAAVTAQATAGSGPGLALLLLLYGIGGVLGNVVAGPLTDRIGSRRAITAALAAEAVVLIAMPVLHMTYLEATILFVIWGAAAFAAVVPLQHRMVAIDPATAALALSWYTTAMYIGVAVAPPIGAAALTLAGPALLPVVGAIAVLAGLAAFHLGYLRRTASSVSAPRRRRSATAR